MKDYDSFSSKLILFWQQNDWPEVNLVSQGTHHCQKFGTHSLVGQGATSIYNWFPATGRDRDKFEYFPNGFFSQSFELEKTLIPHHVHLLVSSRSKEKSVLLGFHSLLATWSDKGWGNPDQNVVVEKHMHDAGERVCLLDDVMFSLWKKKWKANDENWLWHGYEVGLLCFSGANRISFSVLTVKSGSFKSLQRLERR